MGITKKTITIMSLGATILALSGCGNNNKLSHLSGSHNADTFRAKYDSVPTKENINNNKVLQNTKETRIATIRLHRESSMLGAALNMEAFLNGKKVSQKLYNNDTIVNKVKHNGTIVIQVENEVKKITNVKNGATIICSASSIIGSGSEFIENAFMLNGFSPKLALELKCNK